MTSQYGSIIAAIATALGQAAPMRTVVRDLKDFSDYDETVIKAGVYTLISKGMNADASDIEYLDLLLVGQIQVDEGSAPSVVEEAELLMLDEVRIFTQKIQGVRIVRGQFRQSAQIDAPYGFISGELTVGPFDFDLPADTTIADFITFHADSQIDADPEPELITEETLPQ